SVRPRRTKRRTSTRRAAQRSPPRPANTRAKERAAAPSPTAFYYPATTRPPPEPSESLGPRMAATEFRELSLVGARGFEPPTFRSRTERATRLRHAPSVKYEAGRYAGTVDLPNLASPVNGGARSAARKAHPPQEDVPHE